MVEQSVYLLESYKKVDNFVYLFTLRLLRSENP